jgi:hypothetical protein
MPPGTGSMPGSQSGTGSTGSAGSAAGSATTAGTGSAGAVAGSTGSGVMTAQERVAVLDGQLGSAYGDFDGLILAERSRAQRQSNDAGADPGGLYDQQGGGGFGGAGAGAGGLPGVVASGPGSIGGGTGPGVIASSSGDGQGPQAGGSGGSVGGLLGGPAGEQGEYPIPDDIPPSGRDDDVVARQIREAAMREPDPELREALWDEYRRYTGIRN